MKPVRRLELREFPDPTGSQAGPADQTGAAALTCKRLDARANLVDAFHAAVIAREGYPALVEDAGAFTYRWFWRGAQAVRGALQRQSGFRRGDRVAILCENRAAYVAAFFGILAAEGVAVPLPVDIEGDRLATVLQKCGIGVALTAEGLPGRVAGQLGQPEEVVSLGGSQEEKDTHAATRGDLAAIMLTAGSSGEPKLVMLSHGNLLSNAASIIEYLGVQAADRALALLPFHHAFGNSILQTHLLIGATLVRAGSFLFPNSILEALRSHRVTSFSGVPEMFRLLLTRSDLGRQPLGQLRYAAVAGGALSPQQAGDVARRIAPARLFLMYGQTEATARLTFLPPQELDRRPGSAGRAIPGVRVQVVDRDDRPAGPGEVGEVRARGPNVMLGYWGDPEATALAVRQGWLYTGDQATVDEDGYLYLRGRASELVKVSGYRVHPAEIEALVARRLPVQNVAVVACETALGTRLAMFVEPAAQSPAATADDVLTLCGAELPRHKVPVFVEVLSRMPLNHAMKVDRRALERRAAERLAAEPTG
jgi:acyl-CoA synthetase (AMP-forming)/AMP-acid ligase II